MQQGWQATSAAVPGPLLLQQQPHSKGAKLLQEDLSQGAGLHLLLLLLQWVLQQLPKARLQQQPPLLLLLLVPHIKQHQLLLRMRVHCRSVQQQQQPGLEQQVTGQHNVLTALVSRSPSWWKSLWMQLLTQLQVLHS